MLICFKCGLEWPDTFHSHTCPNCETYLKYIRDSIKDTAVKFYNANLQISYAVAEVNNFGDRDKYKVYICIGIGHPYPEIVFRELPEGYKYVSIKDYSQDRSAYIPVELLVSPARTYNLLYFQSEYTDRDEANTVLNQKIQELDKWIDDTVADGWLAICNLGGLLA
jgi:hypothetical protein